MALNNTSFHKPRFTSQNPILTKPKYMPRKQTPRQPGKFVVYNVPEHTTYKEVKEIFELWIPEINIENVSILVPRKKNSDVMTLIAFVKLDSDESVDNVVNYYKECKQKFGTWFVFTNEKGITSELTVTYCYQIHKAWKNGEEHSTGSKFCKSEKSSGYDNNLSILDQIEKDKQSLLSYIQYLEEELKKRLPDLFVSESEMNQLRKEEIELNHNNEVKIEQLQMVRLELQELKVVKAKYDELSDEDEDEDGPGHS